MGFGLFKHGSTVIIAVAGERIEGEAIFPFFDSCNGKRFTAIPFHFFGKTFRHDDGTKFVQTKFGFHIIPLTDGNFISDVVGRIISRVKRFH